MKIVMIRAGEVVVEEAPAPQVEPGMALVQVEHSCISAGTEMSGVQNSARPPVWKRALQNPEKALNVAKMVTQQGLSVTRNLVETRLAASAAGRATGYSAAGTVLEVGADIDDLFPGDRVACAGAQYAHHAEVIAVPRNLTVRIPDGLDFAAASTVTLGAIALQGVRRAQPTLGETFVVIGLGILGQLTAQILRANGCRVIGTDLFRDRIELALKLGMEMGIHPDDGDNMEQVARLTAGIGADGVIITAATPSDTVISTAFKMCRRKGRVVLVGDVGLHLNRADFYEKEIDFFISTSYGPGRYDRRYEEDGLDYPVAYVRWTENRNMNEYLRLLAENRLDVKPLIHAVYGIEKAAEAYRALESGENRPLIVLLSYPRAATAPQRRTIVNPAVPAAAPGAIKLAVIGAGDFARGVHLPNLRLLGEQYDLHTIVTRSGDKAAAIARQFGAKHASTDYSAVLLNPDVSAVLISTRHNLHAEMALQALRAGKHTLVEKPLALTSDELKAIEDFFTTSQNSAPILLTGFNRRFSPVIRRAGEILQSRRDPMLINYRMNAGYIPLNHWVHGEEGGGRNRGEACHIYDVFTYLTGSRVVSVSAQHLKPSRGYYSARDNFVATITFEDGSLATLTYTALGSNDHPKELMEIYVESKVIIMEDYKRLSVIGAKMPGIHRQAAEKGHLAELEAFARAIRQGGEWPIPLWQQIQATTIALEVEKHLGV